MIGTFLINDKCFLFHAVSAAIVEFNDGTSFVYAAAFMCYQDGGALETCQIFTMQRLSNESFETKRTPKKAPKIESTWINGEWPCIACTVYIQKHISPTTSLYDLLISPALTDRYANSLVSLESGLSLARSFPGGLLIAGRGLGHWYDWSQPVSALFFSGFATRQSCKQASEAILVFILHTT